MNPVKKNLRSKIITLFLIVVLVSMLVMLISNYYITMNNQYDQYIEYNQNMLYMEADLLGNLFKQVSDTSLIPYSNNEFYQLLVKANNNVDDNSKIKVFLQNMLSSNMSIKRIRLYSAERSTEFVASAAGAFINPSADSFSYILPYNSIKLDIVPDNKQAKLFFELAKDDVELTIERSLYTIPGKKYLGNIELTLDLSKTLATSEQEVFNQFMMALMVGEDYLVLENPIGCDSHILSEYFERIVDNESLISSGDNIIISSHIPFPQSSESVYLIKVLSNSSIRELAMKLSAKSILIGLVVMLVSIVIIANIASRFTKPFSYIEEQLQKISKGNLDVKMDIKSGDEFGIFAQRFNDMITTVNEVIISDYKLQISNKNNQLKALQAQLDPHFINNTLQNIGAEALRSNNLVLYSSVVKFGRMMQYTMNFVSLKVKFLEELEYTENYIDLQKMRFKDRFIADIKVSDDAKNIIVPKLLLQPLVENIFKHGIAVSKDTVLIEINAHMDNGYLLITCKNDGVGLSESRLNDLREALMRARTEDDESLHIGLRNLSRRLYLVYGDESEINLFSNNGIGFEIDIKIPGSTV